MELRGRIRELESRQESEERELQSVQLLFWSSGSCFVFLLSFVCSLACIRFQVFFVDIYVSIRVTPLVVFSIRLTYFFSTFVFFCVFRAVMV